MITWLVIQSIWLLLLTACVIGQQFRINDLVERSRRP